MPPGIGLVPGHLEKQLAGQRVAIGVQSGRRQADQHVARADRPPRNQGVLFDPAHHRSGQIVLACRVQPRHLRGFAANQRTAVFAARARNARDYARGGFGVQLAHRQVVKEKQRHGALNGDVIDAVIHQVLANRIVPTGGKRDLELGAHAVHGAHQNWLLEACQRVARAKRADLCEDPARKGALGHFLDSADGAVGFVDVNTCVAITNSLACDHLRVDFTSISSQQMFPEMRFTVDAIYMDSRRGRCVTRSGPAAWKVAQERKARNITAPQQRFPTARRGRSCRPAF